MWVKEVEYWKGGLMDKGYNDLEATIERLEFRNAKLHEHNEKIEQEILQLREEINVLREDNVKLAKQIDDKVRKMREVGAI